MRLHLFYTTMKKKEVIKKEKCKQFKMHKEILVSHLKLNNKSILQSAIA